MCTDGVYLTDLVGLGPRGLTIALVRRSALSGNPYEPINLRLWMDDCSTLFGIVRTVVSFPRPALDEWICLSILPTAISDRSFPHPVYIVFYSVDSCLSPVLHDKRRLPKGVFLVDTTLGCRSLLSARARSTLDIKKGAFRYFRTKGWGPLLSSS